MLEAYQPIPQKELDLKEIPATLKRESPSEYASTIIEQIYRGLSAHPESGLILPTEVMYGWRIFSPKKQNKQIQKYPTQRVLRYQSWKDDDFEEAEKRIRSSRNVLDPTMRKALDTMRLEDRVVALDIQATGTTDQQYRIIPFVDLVIADSLAREVLAQNYPQENIKIYADHQKPSLKSKERMYRHGVGVSVKVPSLSTDKIRSVTINGVAIKPFGTHLSEEGIEQLTRASFYFQPGLCCEKAEHFLQHYGRYEEGGVPLETTRNGTELLVDHHILTAYHLLDHFAEKKGFSIISNPAIKPDAATKKFMENLSRVYQKMPVKIKNAKTGRKKTAIRSKPLTKTMKNFWLSKFIAWRAESDTWKRSF